jgi:hypothetical protein
MELSEFSSINNQNYSFENNNTFVPEFIKVDDIEDLFKMDNILNYFTNTLINTKELNFDKDINNEKEDNIILDKKFVENIQWKEREKILSKRPFKEKKDLGRKKKEYEGLGLHNKFSDDNIIRKVKNAILQNTRIFINSKIKTIYEYKNNKFSKRKELLKMKKSQPISSRVDYNKNFLEKNLGEIFSDKISSKYIQYPSSHNKKLIESLINDEDEQKRKIFNEIFNLTFLDCLNHFRGSKIIEELKGLNNLEEYLKRAKIIKDKEYCTIFKYFVNNFEKIIMDKKSRIKNKK